MAEALTLPDLRKELFFRALVQLPYVEAIYVYGSHSTGRATENSDVDLAIECPDASDEEWQHIRNIIDNTPCLLTFDVERMDKIPHSVFYHNVIKIRSLLYMRTPISYLDMILWRIDDTATHLSTLKKVLCVTNPTAEDIKKISLSFYDAMRFLIRGMRRALLVHDLRTSGRVMTLRYALQKGWIEDRKIWEEMYMAWMMVNGNTPEPYILAEILTKMPLYVTHLDAAAKNLKQFYDDEKQAIDNSEFSPHSSVKSDHA